MFTKDFTTKYFKTLGIENDDNATIEKALETAHRIRKFEIEMYWKRALYFWGFEAVLIATLGSMLSKPEITSNHLHSVGLLMLCVLGTILSLFWLLMTKGAKFWQDNWERHVDLLEEASGVNLYKTHPIFNSPNKPKPPFSVSKINEAVIWLIINI